MAAGSVSSRRSMLRAGVAGLAGLTLGALGKPRTAEAAAGGSLVMGASNDAGTSNTTLSTASTGTALLVNQNSTGTALRGVAGNGIAGFFTSANGSGVSGVVAAKDKYGVYGANDSVTAGTGAAMRANGMVNYGVVATTYNGMSQAIKATNLAAVIGGEEAANIAVLGLSAGATLADVPMGCGPAAGMFLGKAGVVGAAAGAAALVGVEGTTTSTNSAGVRGIALATTGSSVGVLGASLSKDGAGVSGLAPVVDGLGVLGTAMQTGIGVQGVAQGEGTGVSGWASDPGSGGYGVTGRADSATGVGVYGVNTVASGIGVYGETTSGYALYGKATDVTGRALECDGAAHFQDTVYADMDVWVIGSVHKGGGSFKIDHPLDPANKYLYHSFVESPDMMNVYNGIATLDAKGEATIELPDWFEALNRDYRYQLTPIGAAERPLFVKSKLAGGAFSIGGGKPGQEVSWQLTGIRKDAWANAHRIPVEEAKPKGEVGLYLHPSEHGKPAEKGLSATRRPPVKPARPIHRS